MKNNKNDEMLDKYKMYVAISNFCDDNKNKRNRKYPQKNILMKWREYIMKKRIIATACAGIILISGVVFATDIGTFIKNFFGANSSDGVDTAINNGYVSNVNTEYKNADGIEIQVESVLIDDFNFDMNFNVKVNGNYDIDEFEHLDFEDLRIVDEEKNIVFDTHTSMEGKTEEELENEKHYMGSYSFLPMKINDNEFKVSLSATGNPKAFPKSKKLIIDLTKITTYKYENEEKICKGYKGNWHFEVDVPEEFYNRTTNIYRATKCNESGIDLNSITASVSNTAFKISIPEIKTNKINYKALKEYDGVSIYNMIALQNEYIETSDGRKFETAQRSDGDGGYSLPTDEEKIINYSQTFNLTKYDSTDKVNVHIFTNKGEEIVIELEKQN